MPLIDYFPKNLIPRPQQIEALEKIESIWESGKKYVIAVLPTGVGKSAIAKTVGESSRDIDDILKAKILDYSIYKTNGSEYIEESNFENAEHFGSFILTINKSLQDQYQKSFIDGFVLKGKNNYQCAIDDDFSAEFAPCTLTKSQLQSCFSENICPYYRNRNESLVSKTPVLNYSVFFNLPKFLQKREFLILDEAAEIEDELISKYSLFFNYKLLKSDGIIIDKLKTEKKDLAYVWLKDIKNSTANVLKDLMDEAIKLKNSSNIGHVQKISQKIIRIRNLLRLIIDCMENWVSADYIIEKCDDYDVVFTPYNIKPFISRIFERAKKVLLMSATISNPVEYARSLGLKPDEYSFFEIGSPFNPKKSPIICSRKYSLNYKTINQNLPKLIDLIFELCENHKNEKGIIHTHTNFITNEIKKRSNNSRFLFRLDNIKNEKILEEHKNSKQSTILVSPSLDTGVSLDDDLGRFQIIVKAPYLPLNSNRIKKMFKESPEKYQMKMLDCLIQMSGRCTRSINDYSVTYIIDGTIVSAIEKNSEKLPHHFIERIV